MTRALRLILPTVAQSSLLRLMRLPDAHPLCFMQLRRWDDNWSDALDLSSTAFGRRASFSDYDFPPGEISSSHRTIVKRSQPVFCG